MIILIKVLAGFAFTCVVLAFVLFVIAAWLVMHHDE